MTGGLRLFSSAFFPPSLGHFSFALLCAIVKVLRFFSTAVPCRLFFLRPVGFLCGAVSFGGCGGFDKLRRGDGGGSDQPALQDAEDGAGQDVQVNKARKLWYRVGSVQRETAKRFPLSY